jgi:hypothetical protein
MCICVFFQFKTDVKLKWECVEPGKTGENTLVSMAKDITAENYPMFSSCANHRKYIYIRRQQAKICLIFDGIVSAVKYD